MTDSQKIIMSLIQESRSRDEDILSCIDRGLEKVGPGVKRYVYWHLHKIAHVEKSQILAEPDVFIEGLESIYHESVIAVQKSIVEEINSVFHLSFASAKLKDAILQARKVSVVKK